MANTKRSESASAAAKRTLSYDIRSLHTIARRVNWNAIHGPKWMKAGRFIPGPGLGDLQRSREEATAADVAKTRDR